MIFNNLDPFNLLQNTTGKKKKSWLDSLTCQRSRNQRTVYLPEITMAGKDASILQPSTLVQQHYLHQSHGELDRAYLLLSWWLSFPSLFTFGVGGPMDHHERYIYPSLLSYNNIICNNHMESWIVRICCYRGGFHFRLYLPLALMDQWIIMKGTFLLLPLNHFLVHLWNHGSIYPSINVSCIHCVFITFSCSYCINILCNRCVRTILTL